MKIYISHPIRGSISPTDPDLRQKINSNLMAACGLGRHIRETFPAVVFYLPAEHEELVNALGLTETEILHADLKIINTCDAMICLDWDVSSGMDIERKHCDETGKKWKNVWGPDYIGEIHDFLSDLMSPDPEDIL